jgi:hypothetical protein
MADLTAMLQAAAGQVGGEYQISRSLRFNSADSAYLSRTPASASNRKTWTWSGWVKKALIADNNPMLFTAGSSAPYDQLYFDVGSDKLNWFTNGGLVFLTNAGFRDPSAWYHIVLSVDTTQATNADRAKLYVNGVVQTFSTYNGVTQNTDTKTNNNEVHNIGRLPSPNFYFNGYLTEINFIDGQALTPSSFGETNETTGVWSPIRYAGSYGTNGFYLNFSNNSGVTSTTLGKDRAGSNNWTPNNFSVTAGAGNDSLVDTPTPYGTDTGAGGQVRGNYATLNPLNNGSQAVLSNGNLDVSWSSTSGHSAGSTIAVSSGKWYVEFTRGSSVVLIGIIPATYALKLDNWPGNSAYGTNSYSYYSTNGNKYNNSSNTAYGASFTTGDVIGVALDLDAGTLVFYKNGVSQGTAYSSITGSYIFAIGYGSSPTGGTVANANFGQRPFAYTAPSGFKALCTTNLPEPTVVQGDDYFNTVIYTGTGAARTITVGFQPDFVWLKSRVSAVWYHQLYDVIRAPLKALFSNTTDAESTYTDTLTAFTSDGFNLGTDATYNGPVNNNGDTYVSWNWKANGAGVSNTDGTISSTVSVSTTSGFSIVTYTGNGTAGATVGHGLGVIPAMVIIKSRSLTGSTPSANWVVWHQSISAAIQTSTTIVLNSYTGAIYLNFDFGSSSYSIDAQINGATQTYVAYCFAEVEGFSKFGSYTGNGSADGPFVYTGFRPAFVMVKNASATNNWAILDAARNPYNGMDERLHPNLTNATNTGAGVVLDALSNGFKCRNSDSLENGSGNTIIYMAFASNPFKFALAR